MPRQTKREKVRDFQAGGRGTEHSGTKLAGIQQLLLHQADHEPLKSIPP